jgi:hypothetical protein
MSTKPILLAVTSLLLTSCWEKKSVFSPSPAPVTPDPIATTPKPYEVIDEQKQPQFTIESQKVFQAAQLPSDRINFNPQDLLFVLKNTRQYFQNHHQADPDLAREGILGSKGVSVNRVLDTLDFAIDTLETDIKNQQPIRLQDSQFLNANFETIAWKPHNPKKIEQKLLRLTKYAVFSHPGSKVKTDKFSIGIYALKPDAKDDKLRLKYTKQEVVKGIYEPNGVEFGQVEPLAYLDRTGLEDALMEGTVKINFTDGTSGLFNVDKSNEISYIKGIDKKEQKRYWYFRAVKEIKGYGHSIESKISVKPGVTFAGDVLNIGLGKLIAIEDRSGKQKQIRLGVLADTGGAFLPNLYQLDFLAGVFKNTQEFAKYTRNLPEYARSYILVKKPAKK